MGIGDYMVIMDLSDKVLGHTIKVRRRRLAVLRYLLRGYSAPEALEELQRLPWWEGWGVVAVRSDMRALREGIRAYGSELPEVQEAISWALGYYTDTIKEYEHLIKRFEREGRDDLAIRYRNMRDRLAEKAFSALGVSNINITPGGMGGGSWESVKAFFGIEDMPAPEPPKPSGSKRSKKSKKKGVKKRIKNA